MIFIIFLWHLTYCCCKTSKFLYWTWHKNYKTNKTALIEIRFLLFIIAFDSTHIHFACNCKTKTNKFLGTAAISAFTSRGCTRCTFAMVEFAPEDEPTVERGNVNRKDKLTCFFDVSSNVVEEHRCRSGADSASPLRDSLPPAKPGLLSTTSKHTNYERRKCCTCRNIDRRDRCPAPMCILTRVCHGTCTYCGVSRITKKKIVESRIWDVIVKSVLIAAQNLPAADDDPPLPRAASVAKMRTERKCPLSFERFINPPRTLHCVLLCETHAVLSLRDMLFWILHYRVGVAVSLVNAVTVWYLFSLYCGKSLYI